MLWYDKRYYSINYYIRNLFEEKLMKISFDAGFSCPNRDGLKGFSGCIFCSEKGSGDFAGLREYSIKEQFDYAIAHLNPAWRNKNFIGYFQAFTNTYAPIDILEKTFSQALEIERILAISIGTRPDCIDADIAELLNKLSLKYNKKIFIELGLQTSNEKTAELINRQYQNIEYTNACQILKKNNIEIITHLIIGLPFESQIDILNTIKFCCQNGTNGLKLQSLHVLSNTKLEEMYNNNLFDMLTCDQYIDIIINCLEIIPQDIVIHRLTGDGPKKILVAPLWNENKKQVLNKIDKQLELRNTYQGRLLL